MKASFQSILRISLAVLILSCETEKESATPGPGPSGQSAGAVTPVGVPEGAITTAQIGPAGGVIASPDNRISVVIPAGALSATQAFSVQSITNNCPAGEGQAFRLLPHGVNFAKPVIVTFRYDQSDIEGSTPALMRIASQNEKGIWKSPLTKSLDTTARTLSVETTHFSDWALFLTMQIDPVNVFLNPGENVHLSGTYIAGTPEELGVLSLGLPEAIPANLIDKWTLDGEGTLKGNNNVADYSAPQTIPATNPAAVTLILNKPVKNGSQEYKDVRLVSNIFVAPEGLSVQIDNGAWHTYTAGVNGSGGRYMVVGKDGGESASVSWKGAPSGTFHWTKSADVAFNLNKSKLIYQQIYGKALNVSGGSVRVDQSDAMWVTGTFVVQPAGWLNTATQPISIGTAAIRGVFRVKRVGQL
ncbi:hypothetical protein SAMN05216327_104183 [Dyadobacter sp. SG02]|uniref:hypothetical protein n=1 Tax=Dyadobacter sp. SG02 TaxID=1855291 RepID=UPI0008B0D641|nr:hypothetical protein [Dyadobacter sp. SG02]SEI84205.1 hypothetical protein SAMN05216327_104183 [Dyadobacter sp. SG02]